ncbi:hypothetical protein [Parapedobacter sp. 10938]|uniref:hypothetical protein n=1 Tax=Parapedobacter flavus TaxID=3110225 RepID=UPI002DC02E09|nr:hypothetical protein [Parapedobacter sp. 10938]MEC3881886.1 hypothetical protein [Parapedobacter sp. 10938]
MKTYTIPKTQQLHAALDYDRLRQEGLKHIEQLASDLWTDYNAHDPGITILEALCYAITELGYRCSFEMKHLLHDATDQVLYPARQILTNHPFTLADYRKLLIDIDGINNAWLSPSNRQEIPFFFNGDERKLQVEPSGTAIQLNGLYDVVLDFERDEQYGDLNTGDVELTTPGGDAVIKFEFPSYDDISRGIIKEPMVSVSAQPSGAAGQYELVLTSNAATTYHLPFAMTVTLHPPTGKITAAQLDALLEDTEYVQQLADTFLLKLKQVDTVFKRVRKQLHAHRNLCEDFLSIKQVGYEEIAFCMDVDVSADADIERVQAELLFALERYLSPSVNFYSLKELLEKGWETQDIYTGVALTNGFVDPKELDETQLRTHVYASDVINLLMDIDGVLAIRNLLMTKYGQDGKPINGFIGRDWCMAISEHHKPVLSHSQSKILLFKNGYPFRARVNEVSGTLSVMRAQHTLGKRKGHDMDIPIETGQSRDTLSYWPVQYDLPAVYGVGEAGLPPHADTLRRAQQRQLKGYLLFFEQLLADFFAQLSNAKRLFSIEDIKQTYFAQYLDDIKDTDGLRSTDLKTAIDAGAGSAEWQALYERQTAYNERRNRFLDHLLARFAESFNDFALLRYQINYEEQTTEHVAIEELIDAKIQTLKQYPDLSANRSKAFNYFPQTETFDLATDQLWNTDNVSGLEKRIGALTGIQDLTRRFLYCIKHAEIQCEEENVEGEIHCMHRFEITSREGVVFASSKFPIKADAETALTKVIDLAATAGNYVFAAGKITLMADGERLMETVDTVESAGEADEIINKVATEFGEGCTDSEGFHLLEHTLLRPRTDTFQLMDLCEVDGDCLCELDPYSFRASVVLPYWPDHFDHPAFRNYFESKLQEEAPAHIQIKVCWVGNDQLRQFEARYKAWMAALAGYFHDDREDASALQAANDSLLLLLPQLKNVYPQATLHNCAESNIENNPVMLGRTILGTYLNQ